MRSGSRTSRLFTFPDEGPLTMRTAGGRKVLCSLELLTRTLARDRISRDLAVPRFRKGRDGIVSALAAGDGWATELVLDAREGDTGLAIRARTSFSAPTKIVQQALVLTFARRAVRAYSKSGRELAPGWGRLVIGAHGCVFGSGRGCAFVANARGLSSLVLEGRRVLVANLDFWLDHQQVVCGRDGRMEDASCPVFRPGDTLEGGVTVHAGFAPPVFPRVLHTASGTVAAHVWNEHACYTHTRLHRALYFGREDIEKPEDAVGGFCRHGIPVTKSVFHDNKGRRTDDQTTVFTGLMPSLKTHPEFASLVRDLHGAGHEICLHSVQPGKSTPEEIREACAAMEEQFSSESWIDHAAFAHDRRPSPHIAPESAMMNGLAAGHPLYMIPAWKKHGIRYLWNGALEYHLGRGRMWRYGEWRHLFREYWKKASLKVRVLWYRYQHDPVSKLKAMRFPLDAFGTDEDHVRPFYTHPVHGMVFWNTLASYTFLRETGPHDTYTYDALDEVISRWGVCLRHAYPTFVGDFNGAWETGPDGLVRTAERFEAFLAMLKGLERDGVVWNATVRDYLGHNAKLDDVRLRFRPDGGGVTVANEGSADIPGLTLAVRAELVTVSGGGVGKKRLGQDTIVWFDLKAGEERTVTGS
jgi:hypothetical protein